MDTGKQGWRGEGKKWGRERDEVGEWALRLSKASEDRWANRLTTVRRNTTV
jgi:hypothetical protein